MANLSRPLSAGTRLGDYVETNDYFADLFAALERRVTFDYLGLPAPLPAPIADIEASHLLRFADLLSNSDDSQHRDLAYSIISLLHDDPSVSDLLPESRTLITEVSEAVLIQLGNFPGIATLRREGGSAVVLPFDREFTRATKEVLQRSKHGDETLTDSQFELVDALDSTDFFSFSGPTSLGKSFVIKDTLFSLVRRAELDQHCIVVLVPTKALISQTASDLRRLFADNSDVNVATFPKLPKFLQGEFPRTVFVFTPERLLSYLSNPVRDIDYVFVDEAHRVIAEGDTRSSLYYHSIAEASRRFATKLVFASPNVSNPELFLHLFQKSPLGAMAKPERTVAQRRYFIDFVDAKMFSYSARGSSQEAWPLPAQIGDITSLLDGLSAGQKSLVYLNGSAQVSQAAIDFVADKPDLQNSELEAAAQFVEAYVHKSYFLADCLRRGVAFHHGRMPQEVRERVENLFAKRNSLLRYIFCTSTLLEGVNLPAKNIFVLTDRHGSGNFHRIDFENLVGRAGRLTQDFSGNVICVRSQDKRWPEATRQFIGDRSAMTAASFMVSPGRRTKAFTDIAKVLRGQALPGNPSVDTTRSVEQYSSILLIHQLDQQSSPLRTQFLEKVEGAAALLRTASTTLLAPVSVLRKSPDIQVKYQNKIWSELQGAGSESAPLMSSDADLDDPGLFLGILRRLYVAYGWNDEESRGRDPLVSRASNSRSGLERLDYWAVLMRTWVRGDAISRVIASSLRYQQRRGIIGYRDYSKKPPFVEEVFDPNSAFHINLVIEETLKNLEGGLRFRILRYLQNFYDLSLAAHGPAAAGVNVAELVEYGSTDSRVIGLQEVGFSRSVSIELVRSFEWAMSFDETGSLVSIDVESLRGEGQLDQDIRLELENVIATLTA